MSGVTIPNLSSKKMLQQKRERDIPKDKRESSGQMKKCQKCTKKWFYTMLQKCIKCNYSFCCLCQIKQSSDKGMCGWACSICSFINEEQYKIDLNHLEDEVKGTLKSDNWHKCTACYIETDIKYNFFNSKDLYKFLNMKGLITDRSNLSPFNSNPPIEFEKEVHFCDACIYYLLTPPFGGIDMFMLFFSTEAILHQGHCEHTQIHHIDNIINQDFDEYSTHVHSRNNTSEKKKTISVNSKIFGISKENAKKNITFGETKRESIINMPIEEKTFKEIKKKENNDDLLDSFEKQSTKANSITSDISFTLLNQYPKNYNPITYEYLQQLKCIEEVIYVQIQSFYSFIKNIDHYLSNPNYYLNYQQQNNNSCLYQNNPHIQTNTNTNTSINSNNNNNNQVQYTMNNTSLLNKIYGMNPFNADNQPKNIH